MSGTVFVLTTLPPLFRQQVLLEMEEQEYWDCLKAQAAAMDKERGKVKGEKKQ